MRVKPRMPKKLSQCLGAFAISTLLSLSSAVLAQHAMHDMGGSNDIQLSTMPSDNAVLASAPDTLMLHFGPMVRLVKLAVKDPESSVVDIGFRYSPNPGHEFMQPLPSLPDVDYYTVEWASIDSMGRLTRGNFHFSFGDDARPPSYWLDQREQMRHFMAPDYRLLDPN